MQNLSQPHKLSLFYSSDSLPYSIVEWLQGVWVLAGQTTTMPTLHGRLEPRAPEALTEGCSHPGLPPASVSTGAETGTSKQLMTMHTNGKPLYSSFPLTSQLQFALKVHSPALTPIQIPFL